MQDIRKINSMQLYYMWRNMAISLMCIGALMVGSHMFPYYMAPVVSLFLCGVLYTLIWNNRVSNIKANMIVMEAMLYSLLCYTFVSILLVVIQVLGLYEFPKEVIFFNDPYLPSLILLPISLVVAAYALCFKKSMPSYRWFGLKYGGDSEGGYYGLLSKREVTLQLKNMVAILAILTCVVWYYYLYEYVNINQNGRDWYVFVWFVVIAVLLDEIYFIQRYYNLYLDLLEHDEIITPEELCDVTAHTYLRFYVISGEYVYIDRNAFDRLNQKKGVFDTPFITKKTVNGIPTSEVRNIVEEMTGAKGGELKFFFGRHLAGVDKHSLLRYFYFLDGDISDYKNLKTDGEWVHFNDIKAIYNRMPLKIATNALNDLSRLSTIMLTEKLYDDDGFRKNKIKSYKGSLTLSDVRKSKLDFQDDKWIRIAYFNSDSKFFRLKKFLRGGNWKKTHSPSRGRG